MSEPKRIRYITSEDYLDQEADGTIRHEFVRGQVFAMSAATEDHNTICGNVFSALHSFLDGSGSRVFINDMKVRIEAADSFYYPDIMVTCEPYEGKSVFKISPILIVEVLSPSTQQIDRREKLIAYQQIKSLRQYIIVHQKRMLIEEYSRIQDDQWEHQKLRRNEQLCLKTNCPLQLSLDAIYRHVELPPQVEESEEEYELA